MADFSYEIKSNLGVLSEKKGYTKEVNLISYNGKEPVYDIRTWYTQPSGEKKMTKGITLNKDEIEALKMILLEI